MQEAWGRQMGEVYWGERGKDKDLEGKKPFIPNRNSVRVVLRRKPPVLTVTTMGEASLKKI